MFVIELIYKADLAQIDAAMKAHVAWLRTHYAAGTFVVSGRKVPRDGGIILALGKSRDEIEAIMREDPFASTVSPSSASSSFARVNAPTTSPNASKEAARTRNEKTGRDTQQAAQERERRRAVAAARQDDCSADLA